MLKIRQLQEIIADQNKRLKILKDTITIKRAIDYQYLSVTNLISL